MIGSNYKYYTVQYKFKRIIIKIQFVNSNFTDLHCLLYINDVKKINITDLSI